MNSNTYLIIRDVTNHLLNNKDKSQIELENEIIKDIRSRYSDINYHSIYATIENYCNATLSREESERSRVQMLRRIPQFEQRTTEWYNVRNLMVTASDIATVVNDNPYQKPITVLRKKCGLDDKFTGNKYTEWGVKYEEIANMIYQLDYDTTVIEFGLIQHPNISFLGASPDGITVDGIMLEIKCPFTRKLDATVGHDGVPHYYWIQVQIQLEVCELEYCDFQQCELKEYESKEEYDNDEFDGYRGCVVCEKVDQNKLKYHYPPSLTMQENELNDWLKQFEDEKYYVTWWKLVNILYTRIQRDREWFREKLPVIEKFWHDVVYYRRHGTKEILPKPRKKKPVVCLLDSDSEEDLNKEKNKTIIKTSPIRIAKTGTAVKAATAVKTAKKRKQSINKNTLDSSVCLL